MESGRRKQSQSEEVLSKEDVVTLIIALILVFVFFDIPNGNKNLFVSPIAPLVVES